MLLVFLAAGVDAIRLLSNMRAENKILRDASLERSQRLASIRSSILPTQTYLGDYMLDLDEQRASDHLAQLRDAWSSMLAALSDYRTTTLEEAALLKQLQVLLDQHWKDVTQAMSWSSRERRRRGASFYGDEILPLRTAVLEITARVEGVDARQLASTEAGIQTEFESLGRRLSVLLSIGLGVALVLAVGCFAYILRIERQNRRRYGEILETRSALQQLSARLVEGQETERRTISRELHDEIGQALSAVLVDAANLASRIPDGDAVARRYLDNIRTLADSSVNSIRDIALLLRPSMLDDLGLIPALEWQAREVSRRSGIKVKVVAENVPETLDDILRTCVYRVVQEALHNASSHSGAKNVLVSVRQADGSLELSVEDDGLGFDPQRTR